MSSPFLDPAPLDVTFETVDDKLAETEFFLQQMAGIGMDGFAFKCYLSAYLAAARTVTLALQRFAHIPGFAECYEPHRARLKSDPLSGFLFTARNDHLHGGPYPIAGASLDRSGSKYYFARLDVTIAPPQDDVVTVCREHLIKLLEVVLDCYATLGPHIDPQQHYTKEHFKDIGRGIDEAECEVFGWVNESLVVEGFDEDDRWHEVRGNVQKCTVNNLFFSYLGKVTPQPKEPEHYADFAATPEDNGWTIVPAGFESLQDYWEQYPERKPTEDPGPLSEDSSGRTN